MAMQLVLPQMFTPVERVGVAGGEHPRVMGLLRRVYVRLHLKVNETKNAVASVFTDRKFLGYSFWVASKGIRSPVAPV